VSPGAALSGALLAALATPATWPLALGTFFLRGGLFAVLLPIVVLPSPVGLGNLLAPTLMTFVFRGVSLGIAIAIGLFVCAILAWVVVGGLVAATLEAEAARIVADLDDAGGTVRSESDPVRASAPSSPRVASRILAARLVAHVPTAVALIWGSTRLVGVAYRELTTPFDVASPIALRVLGGAPEVVVLVVGLWMLGEIIGGMAARRIALAGAGVQGAIREAMVAAIRNPVVALLGFWVPTAGLILVLVPSAVAAATALGIVRMAMRSPADPLGATLAVLLFVSLWMAGLLLLAVTAAWRSAVWSMGHREVRERRAGPTEIGPG
jgi:hypothetical protein